jgi:hypothetical protein
MWPIPHRCEHPLLLGMPSAFGRRTEPPTDYLRGSAGILGEREIPVQRPSPSLRVVFVALLFLTATIQSTAARPASASSLARFTVTAPNSYSAVLGWTLPSEASRIRLFRSGSLLDEFPATTTGTYTDYLLWQSTQYRYRLKAISATGKVLVNLSRWITTPGQVGPFPRLYGDTGFWNVPVPDHPAVDPNSAAMVAASILPYANTVPIDNDDGWGMPIAYASPHSEMYDVGCTKYNCEIPVSFRIPRYAKPNLGSGGDWDGHLAVYDPATNHELDMWEGAYDAATDAWSAGSRSDTVADWGAVCSPGLHCSGGGVAAGFNEFGGVIRPEEIAQGHIDHALVMATPYVRANFISCPATDIWASQSANYVDDPNALPLGGHVWLPRTFDVDAQSWPGWEKVVAHALQDYGAYLADVGANIAVRGEANLDRGYDAWALVGMPTVPHPNLLSLPWAQMQVLQLQPC